MPDLWTLITDALDSDSGLSLTNEQLNELVDQFSEIELQLLVAQGLIAIYERQEEQPTVN